MSSTYWYFTVNTNDKFVENSLVCEKDNVEANESSRVVTAEKVNFVFFENG